MNIKMINDLVIFLFQLKNCSKYDKVSYCKNDIRRKQIKDL